MRRVACLVVLLFTVCVSPVSGQDLSPLQRTTTGVLAVGASLAMMEIVGTEACTQQGSCRESNPVLPDGRGAGATAGRSAIKAAGTAGSVILLAKLRHKHPRWALVGSVAFATFNGWLAANAFDHLRRGQR